MCDFISVVERRGKPYFLTGEIIKSEKFHEIAERRGISPDDYNGHGAIRAYYGIDEGDGVNREYTNFASPDNFPLQIQEAIRAGKMRGLGEAEHLLLPSVYAKWQSERDAVYTKFWDLFASPVNRAKVWR